MGIVQGVTEFLPISSSGHLVLTEHLFGKGETDLFFDAVLHLGTLIAVVIVLWRDVREITTHFVKSVVRFRKPSDFVRTYRADAPFRLGVLILVGTVPAVIIGFTLQSTFESLFGSVFAVGIALCVTGILLLSTRWAPEPKKDALKTGWVDSLIIGLAQAVAITPGISRAGSTISAALFLKIDRDLAGRFSFLLAIPAILGAALLQFKIPGQWPEGYAPSLVAGLVSAALIGYAALKILIGLVKSGKFFYFGFYCIPVGVAAIIGSLM